METSELHATNHPTFEQPYVQVGYRCEIVFGLRAAAADAVSIRTFTFLALLGEQDHEASMGHRTKDPSV